MRRAYQAKASSRIRKKIARDSGRCKIIVAFGQKVHGKKRISLPHWQIANTKGHDTFRPTRRMFGTFDDGWLQISQTYISASAL